MAELQLTPAQADAVLPILARYLPAIWASNWAIGRPAARRVLTIST
jgi:hypothetical protein